MRNGGEDKVSFHKHTSDGNPIVEKKETKIQMENVPEEEKESMIAKVCP